MLHTGDANRTVCHGCYVPVKVIPQQAEMVQGVPGRLRPRIFLKFRHYKGGRSSAKRTGRLYTSRNPWYSLSEAESTSEHMVLSGVPRKKSPVTPPGIDPGTFRLVAQCLNHYTTPGRYVTVINKLHRARNVKRSVFEKFRVLFSVQRAIILTQNISLFSSVPAYCLRLFYDNILFLYLSLHYSSYHPMLYNLSQVLSNFPVRQTISAVSFYDNILFLYLSLHYSSYYPMLHNLSQVLSNFPVRQTISAVSLVQGC